MLTSVIYDIPSSFSIVFIIKLNYYLNDVFHFLYRCAPSSFSRAPFSSDIIALFVDVQTRPQDIRTLVLLLPQIFSLLPCNYTPTLCKMKIIPISFM